MSSFESIFTVEQRETLRWIHFACAIISICSTTFVIATYVVFPNLRSYLFRLIVYLCTSEFLQSVGLVLDLEPRTCSMQAVLVQYFSVAALCWTACIAVNVYRVMVRHEQDLGSVMIYFHSFSWGLPAVLTGINLAAHSFSSSEIWCWIDPDFRFLRLVSYFVPVVVIGLFNLVTYLYVMRALVDDPKLAAVQWRLWQYVAVYLVSHGIPLAARLQEYIDPSSLTYTYAWLLCIFTPLQGCFNALVYGLNMQVRQQFYTLLVSGEPDEDEDAIEMQ
jgi:hypothetical protein